MDITSGVRMKFLSREDIVQANDIQIVPMEIPEWGGVIHLKGLNSAERDAFEKSQILRKKRRGEYDWDLNLANVRARLCVLSICDERGTLLFKEADAEMLGQKSGAAMNRIYERVRELSGFTEKDIEELASSGDDE